MRCVLVAVVLLALAQSRVAAAEDHGDIDMTQVVVLGGLYIGGTGAFAIKDLAGSDPSKAYGVAEVVWNGAFTAVWTSYIISDATDRLSDHDGIATASVLTAVHASLLAHGIYTIVKRRKPAATLQIGRVSAVLTPAQLAGGAGVGVVGTF